MIYLENISIRLLVLGIIFCSFGFSNKFQGVGIQMTNKGAGVYYKPGIQISTNSKVLVDIGLNVNNSIKSASIIDVVNNNKSVFMDMYVGYSRELFRELIAGIFQPVLMLQGGVAVDMSSYSWKNIWGDWIIIYAAGLGFQFYNGKNLNEIMLKINQNTSKELSIAFQLSIYWE